MDRHELRPDHPQRHEHAFAVGGCTPLTGRRPILGFHDPAVCAPRRSPSLTLTVARGAAQAVCGRSDHHRSGWHSLVETCRRLGHGSEEIGHHVGTCARRQLHLARLHLKLFTARRRILSIAITPPIEVWQDQMDTAGRSAKASIAPSGRSSAIRRYQLGRSRQPGPDGTIVTSATPLVSRPPAPAASSTPTAAGGKGCDGG